MEIKYLTILAIETSCDETAAAIIIGKAKTNLINTAPPKIVSSVIYSQLKLHRKTRGIVPEVASRTHAEKILYVIDESLRKAKLKISQIDIIAVTTGPGLIGSLLIGIDTAKALAYITRKPVIAVDHIEAHIYANFVEKKQEAGNKKQIFPAIVLIASGGHTQLILMRGHGDYKKLGGTIDDAAGEAFDKVANILNLGYPGGPAIAAAAAKLPITDYSRRFGRDSVSQRTSGQLTITLPRPMIDSGNFDFSFSGLKTAVLYAVRKKKALNIRQKANMAAEFQRAVADVLVDKTIKAARKYQARSIMLGGGVAANHLLRGEMKKRIRRELTNIRLFIPNLPLCTDNAAIVGICAYYQYLFNQNNAKDYQKIKINL